MNSGERPAATLSSVSRAISSKRRCDGAGRFTSTMVASRQKQAGLYRRAGGNTRIESSVGAVLANTVKGQLLRSHFEAFVRQLERLDFLLVVEQDVGDPVAGFPEKKMVCCSPRRRG